MSTKARKRAIGNHAKGRKNILNRELVFSSPGSEYAKVVESLGGNRLRVLCFSDNLVRLCNIRGTLRRREWVYKDVVLVSMRDYQDTVCDLLLKYNQDEVQKLIMYKEIPENVGAGDENDDEKGPCVIFGEMSEDD